MGADASSFLDNYKQGKELGRGGYGKVFECTRKSDKVKFAVKFIKIDKLSTEEKENLMNEAELMK